MRRGTVSTAGENVMKQCLKWLALFTVVFAAQAQVPDQVRRATISGSGGTSGKCYIEVRVDITAEIDIYGDSGRLRTIAGQPATWTRFECTDPLPYLVTDFRFRGIDGRGNPRVVQDPRSNNAMAVIRIDDPQNGSGAYAFDVEWSGASGGAPTGGFETGGSGVLFPRAGANRRLSAERAIELCSAEVRTRGERDYGLRNVEVTAAAVDTNQGRRDWITGTISQGASILVRGSGYRFNCAVDYNSGQVSSIEILRPDGRALQPGAMSGTYNANIPTRQLLQYQGRDFNLSYPGDWRLESDRASSGVRIAPPSGIQQTEDGLVVGYGAIVAYYRPRASNASLWQATDEFISQLRSADPSMRAGREMPSEIRIGGKIAIVTMLYTNSIYQGQTEVDRLVTVAHPNGILYFIFIAPERAGQEASGVYDQMLQSMRFRF